MACTRKTHLVFQVVQVAAAVIGVCYSQTVLVSMESMPANNGSQAVISCSYSIDQAGYTVYNVQWLKGMDFATAESIADFFGGALQPTYFNNYDQQGITVSRDNDMSNLTFAEVIFDKDNPSPTFWCQAVYRQSLNEESARASTVLNMSVEIKPDEAVVTINGKNTPTGEKYSAQDGQEVSVGLTVKEVYPEPSFWWHLGVRYLPASSVSSQGPSGAGLYDSTSNVTFTPNASDDDQELNCEVIYYSGVPGTTLLVATLEVTESTTPATSPESTATTDSTTDPITGQTTLESSTAILTTESTTDITTDGPGATDESGTGGLSGGAIAGIAVGAVVGGLLVLGLLGGLYHWYSRRPPSVVKPAPANGSHGQENGGQNADSAGKVKEKDG